MVVGGSSGIGKATVQHLVAAGHEVVNWSRSPGETPGVTEASCDVTEDVFPDPPQTLDGVVYCPGTINLKPFTSLKVADFQRDLDVNVLGAVKLIQHVLPMLKRSERASVVLFSTVAVQTGMPYHASIAAAKGAVEGLGRSLAAELAPSVRVNVIAPSLTDTPLAGSLLNSAEKKKGAGERHPLKRVGEAREMAGLVSMLLGDESRFMTGQVIKVDGGLSSVKLF